MMTMPDILAQHQGSKLQEFHSPSQSFFMKCRRSFGPLMTMQITAENLFELYRTSSPSPPFGCRTLQTPEPEFVVACSAEKNKPGFFKILPKISENVCFQQVFVYFVSSFQKRPRNWEALKQINLKHFGHRINQQKD